MVQEGSDGGSARFGDARIPYHDDMYVSLVRHLAAREEFALIWARDLRSAYRQYPVSCPSHGYVKVCGRHDTLWSHRVMPFGATASVFHITKSQMLCFGWLGRCCSYRPSTMPTIWQASIPKIHLVLVSSFRFFLRGSGVPSQALQETTTGQGAETTARGGAH